MRRRAALLFTTVFAGAAVLMSGSGHMGSYIQAEETEETAGNAEEKEAVLEPRMSLQEYPRIDGSTACVPLCEALAARLTGCTDAEAEETMSDFTNTNPCYLKLAEGERDILLAYEPAKETKEKLEEYEPLTMEPVGKDALVFLVNEDNPVDSVTTEQMRDIYTGKITSWSEVGGEDKEIKAFQRPETSGSQTMMRLLLIEDESMAEADTERIASGMDDIIEALKEYDNSADALGYSVYYYASEMFRQPGLKFLKIDGVEPSNESIRTGEYPLVHEFYCVTNEQSSEYAKEIQAWLLTEDGQEFVEECGYVPVQ